jgi:cardiolipin synthase
MANHVRNAFLPGHHVKLIRGGLDYFDTMLKMIQQAVYSISLQVYIFDEDSTGKQVANALVDAAKRNVHVNVLVDGYASQNLSREFVDEIRKAGVYFRRFEPLFKSRGFYLGRRLHHKIIVVDGSYAMVSGINISDRYNDLPETPAWLDWCLYVEGDVVDNLHKICMKRMKRPRFKPQKKVHSDLHQLTEFHKCLVRHRENDWIGGKRQIYNAYLEMFRHATSEIIIMSPYFLPGNEFRRKMRMAIKRGVKIKLVLASISDVFLSKHAERFVYRWLLRNRIEIYEYQQNVLHGKIAVCDGQWVTIGSFNVNDLSAHASIELNLDVKDEKFAMSVKQTLTDIIHNDCVCITNEVYRKDTSLVSRAIQRFSYDLFRLVLFLFTSGNVSKKSVK